MYPDYTPEPEIPYGYCHCGCGQKTKISHTTNPKLGYISGKPRPYLWWHKPLQPLEARFWSKVDKSGGEDSCWLWTARRHKQGYGEIRIGDKVELAHRVSYLLEFGDYDQELYVCHQCDNPPCVNPKHLFLGTHKDNTDDRDRKGRNINRRGEQNGSHKFSDEQVSEMRRRYATGSETQAEIAADFGGSQTHIGKIVNYKSRT